MCHYARRLLAMDMCVTSQQREVRPSASQTVGRCHTSSSTVGVSVGDSVAGFTTKLRRVITIQQSLRRHCVG